MKEENYARTMCNGWRKIIEEYKIERDTAPDAFHRDYWDRQMHHAAERYSDWYNMIPLYD